MMPNNLEKVGNEVPVETQAETTETTETHEPESETREYDETGLQELAEQVAVEVEGDEKRILDNAEKQIAPPPSLGIEQSEANATLERGGFAQRIQAIKDKIAVLTKTIKEKITALFGGQPEMIFNEIANETAQAEANTTIETPKAEMSEPEKAAQEIPQAESREVTTDNASENKSEVRETPEQKERRELNEYLEKDVFPVFGVTVEAQEKAIAEAPEGRREILARSFENIRNSLQEFYAMEVIDGTIDVNERSRTIFLKRMEATVPLMSEELSRRGFGEVNLAKFNLTQDRQEEADQRHPDSLLRSFLDDEQRMVRKDVEATISRTLMNEGRYRDIVFDAKNPDKPMDDETYQKFKAYALEEANQILEQKGLSDESIREAKQKIENVWNSVKIEDIPLVFLHKTPEEITKSLQTEKELADKTNFLCVNIDAGKLENVLTQGGFRDIFNLSEKELKEMQRVQSRGDSFYFNQRKVTEEALGVYDPEVPTVYGTYASENGLDEKKGGANMYGSIFLKLKPDVEAVFCEGDSMSGKNYIGDKKTEKLGINRLDYANYARARQIAPEHAALTKAMNNLFMKIENASGSPVSAFGYLEAHIKGVKVENIETINIPRSYTNPQDWRYGGASVVNILSRLQQDPQWKDIINIIDNE